MCKWPCLLLKHLMVDPNDLGTNNMIKISYGFLNGN